MDGLCVLNLHVDVVPFLKQKNMKKETGMTLLGNAEDTKVGLMIKRHYSEGT